jgi:hypothetical protein
VGSGRLRLTSRAVGAPLAANVGVPVEDPQAILVGIEARAQALGAADAAILVGTEGRAQTVGASGDAVLV